MLERIAERRTDLVFDYVRKGHKPSSKTNGSSLIQWCGYYGDVSAIEFLLEKGETLDSLGKISASMLRLFTAIGGCASFSSKAVRT